MMLARLAWPELLIIAVVALLVFGRRLPELARSLGQSLVEFKKGLRDGENAGKDAGQANNAASTTGDSSRQEESQ